MTQFSQKKIQKLADPKINAAVQSLIRNSRKKSHLTTIEKHFQQLSYEDRTEYIKKNVIDLYLDN